MSNKTFQIFTHNDLDGAVSLLCFFWSNPDAHIIFKEVNNLEIDLIKEGVKRNINQVPTYILDLKVRNLFLPELDKSFITIIDHHEESEKFISNFKNSKILYKNFTSNCLLVRKIFSDNCPTLTKEQKELLLLTDDYDSSSFKYTKSYDLNILFWNQYKNKFVDFIQDYKNGFKPFTKEQENLIKTVKIKANQESESLKKFTGELNIGKSKKNVLGVLSTNTNVLVIDILFKKYDPDILLYINTKTEKVLLKQKRDNDPIDLGKFSEKFCEGFGNTYKAIGKITPLFMELTKNLKPL
jgi:putative IMPACT (imprinted ancient) family translation regulator